MTKKLSPQFEVLDDDKVYKGVHLQYAGRGERRGTSTYSVRYRGTQRGFSTPSTLDGLKKTINEDIANGFAVDPATGHLVHPDSPSHPNNQ